MKNTLHLNLKRQWFDLIKVGTKREEYRTISEYWRRRLTKNNRGEFRTFETITFSNGYSKEREQFTIELKGIRIGIGRKDWGAVEKEEYFILELGNIVAKNEAPNDLAKQLKKDYPLFADQFLDEILDIDNPLPF